MRGWTQKKEKCQKKCLHCNHVFLRQFLCYWCSTLFNHDSYLYMEAFFEEIEWSEVWLRLVFIFDILHDNYFLFLDFLGVDDSSIFMKRIFLFLNGSNLVPLEIELLPGFGLLPSPRLDVSIKNNQICKENSYDPDTLKQKSSWPNLD